MIGGSSPRAGRRPARCARASRSTAAHPRERGDDVGASLGLAGCEGSSPRAGRRPAAVRARPGVGRLIPASGETTTRCRPTTSLRRAHPRERGDDAPAPAEAGRGPGSSPRAGRRLRPALGLHRPGGLIPASGETTSSRRSSGWDPTAHPREQGDDDDGRPHVELLAGSSPRAGRRRRDEARDVAGRRLIPASGETTSAACPPPPRPTAHPRERGDDAVGDHAPVPAEGSSPRAGRRPAAVRARPGVGRLIPASGETTTGEPNQYGSSAAHPRERGDDIVKALVGMGPDGSSPRAGRRLVGICRECPRVRLIPASGETTASGSMVTRPGAAHPRERGDDSASAMGPASANGSSPRAGRRLRGAGARFRARRLIPASGETTPRAARCAPRARAHPRERGDDIGSTVEGCVGAGSSPRAGRRRLLRCRRRAVHRLIPASGETTGRSTGARQCGWAHPRERGDDVHRGEYDQRSVGSSPRAGRRRRRAVGRRGRIRLIPASGETTTASQAARGQSRAHPRERGDDTNRFHRLPSDAGSSPRAGRRHMVDKLPNGARRLIPASGETTVSDPAVTSTTRGSSPRAGRRRSPVRCGPAPVGLIPASGETTTPTTTAHPPRTAHPRERGDDCECGSAMTAGQGSSPRAGRRQGLHWGRRRRHVGSSPRAGRRPPTQQRNGEIPGLIPASGETTWFRRLALCSGRAHPRERGDDSSAGPACTASRGSSPRAGRRPARCDCAGGRAWLIPASGETTTPTTCRSASSAAHPRERGDDPAHLHSRSGRAGSSPRAGRRQYGEREGRSTARLIPASGETTGTTRTRAWPHGAHPRERGDDALDREFAGTTPGSSPRAGRRPQRCRARPRLRRLIPASGETTAHRARPPRTRRAHPRERGDDSVSSSSAS